MKNISLLRYLLLNMRYPLGFVAVTLLFIMYWILVPDEDTPTSIKWTLIGDATLLGVIAGVLTIKWFKNNRGTA